VGVAVAVSGRRLLGLHAALVYAFLYAPIAIVVAYAFNGGRQVLVWDGFSTRWFGEALGDDVIRDALRNSVLIAAGNAVVACVLGTMLALALSRMRPVLRAPFDALVTMTLVTPEIVFGIAALVFFVEVGIQLGLGTILIAHVVFNASVVALVVRARFAGMGQLLEEASYDLGAGPLSTFRQVTLPRLAPAILAGGLLAFTFSFDDFYTSFLRLGRRHDDTTALHLLLAPVRRLTRGQRDRGDRPRADARRGRRRLSRAASERRRSRPRRCARALIHRAHVL
jgi:spermidine/putrescine transport system permease protein